MENIDIVHITRFYLGILHTQLKIKIYKNHIFMNS